MTTGTTLEEAIKKLKGEKTEKLIKSEEISLPKKNGGMRLGAGRKPKEANILARGIKAYLDAHYDEKVKIRVTDPKTGRVRENTKPRFVIALEQLFALGIGQTANGNADALSKWLDRALGKPKQPIVGDEENSPILRIDF
jgi:hypothetical protein